MILTMTMVVRDEEDIVEHNIRFHRSQGVDCFVVKDNLSMDGTTDILKRYESKGYLKFIRDDRVFNQGQWMTELSALAHREFDADWIINNDADEFWWPVNGSLKTTFEHIPRRYNVFRAERHDFVPIENRSSAPFYEQMVYRKKVSLNPLGKPLPPKVAHRACNDVVVDSGNHSVSGLENPNIYGGGIEIFHFPIRTYKQLVSKTMHIGSSYKKNLSIPDYVGSAMRYIYKEYISNPESLDAYYRDRVHSDVRIEREINLGNLVKDERLAEHFSECGRRGFLEKLA